MPLNKFELKELDKDELLTRMKATLAKYPVINQIYEEEFLLILVKKEVSL